jgi:pyruvate/2-oxoglutarate dehydrogenase complex dihydrolipoamide acyltransferase (E2) component
MAAAAIHEGDIDWIEAAFFEAQDVEGDRNAGKERYTQVVRACGTPAAIRSDAELLAGDGAPPESVLLPLLHSLACTALGELSVDEALEAGFPTVTLDCEPLRTAVVHLEAALSSWPANASALVSLALIERDRCNGAKAIRLFERAAALPTVEGRDGAAKAEESDGDQPADAGAWREAWVFAPRRSAVAVAAMTLALIRSQQGEHGKALPLLRRFGFTRRLSPLVWASAAATPPAPPGTPPVASTVVAVAEGETLVAVAEGQEDTPRIHLDAVPAHLSSILKRAFAPAAAYWAQTGYATASAEKQYFTFFYDVSAARPTNAVESLIARLHPLLGRSDVRCAEWWVHTRLAGRHPGHELHYDLEEGVMEATGQVLHPLVSSVVYLAGDARAGPTIVLDERLGGPPAECCWLAHPRVDAFMTFAGDRLHGVLPVDALQLRVPKAPLLPPASAPAQKAAKAPAPPALAAKTKPARAPRARAQANGAARGTRATVPLSDEVPLGGDGQRVGGDGQRDDQQRLTLLIAWYGVDARAASAKRGRGLGPQGKLPRPSRRVSWPTDLEYTEGEEREHGQGEAQHSSHDSVARPRQVPAVCVPHAWEPIPPSDGRTPGAAAAVAADNGIGVGVGPLQVPSHLAQHFFLRSHDDVRERLLREHGVDGTWAAASRKRSRRGGR